MEKKKILMVGLVVVMMVFASFPNISKIVLADSTDTVDIIFQIKGNMSIDVSPNSYNFSVVWANTMRNTSDTEFTIWNNGSVDGLAIDVRITTPPSLDCSEAGPPTVTDSYALLGLKGTVDNTPWYKESGYVALHAALDKGDPQTFGLRLYAGNVSVNTSWETMTITYRGS
jgi:hypothetical protein